MVDVSGLIVADGSWSIAIHDCSWWLTMVDDGSFTIVNGYYIMMVHDQLSNIMIFSARGS